MSPKKSSKKSKKIKPRAHGQGKVRTTEAPTRKPAKRVGAETPPTRAPTASKEALLKLEKRRRAVPADHLVFVGMADIAGVHWCAMQAVFRSRAGEQMYFDTYLHDRTAAARALGLEGGREDKTARSRLLVGEGLSYHDVARSLTVPPRAPLSVARARNELGELDARSFGRIAQAVHGEHHPSLRWHFVWDRYIVNGIADGLTPEFVYEFKTTGSRYLLGRILPSALAQADLYGLFFERARKRVQVLVKDEMRVETYNRAVDVTNAASTLRLFKEVDEGLTPQPPTEAWKCKRCEFRSTCAIARS